ncbi:MAG: CbtA family protein [Nitrososphaera sp.]
MKTLTFIAITLLSGAIAGAILATINQGLVEPFIDRAIDIENQNAIAAGEIFDPLEYDNYRIWQKGGEIAAGTILGTSIAALFGVVFAFSRSSLPGSNNKRKALILAGIMWFVLFLIPALKYPANPPAVGDPETIYYRQSLYIAYLVISGLAALGLAFLYRKMGKVQAKKVIVPAVYSVIMIGAYLAMPPNPDAITAPMDLVIGFRIVSALTMSMFWGIMAVILGSFWDKTKPHETAKITTV